METKRPIVCIFAHPDDEALGPGGSIATFAKTRPVYVICVTKGDAKKALANGHPDDLGKIRRNELLKSAKILGVTRVDFLGFTDGCLCNNMYHELADRLSELVERYQPDTLLTFEPRGVTGHIDHVMVSMVTSFVFTRHSFVKRLLYYCQTERIIKKLRDVYFIHVPEGYTRKECDVVIDIEPVWETKLQAMYAHASQRKDVETILEHQKGEKRQEHFLVVNK